MPTFNNELAAFRDYLDAQMAAGTAITPPEALQNWEQTRQEELAESIPIIRQVLQNIENGEKGMLYEDFLKKFCEKKGIVTSISGTCSGVP